MATFAPEFEDELIRKTFKQLELGGFINIPLLNPAPTKKEYFWLWLLYIAENVVALLIEIINGGVWTSQGHYYSWDIRLISLALAFVFLLAYYKKYHIFRDLTNPGVCGTWLYHLPVFCCCSTETPMKVAADERAMDQVLNPWMTRVGQTVDSSTQTYSDVEVHTVQYVCKKCDRKDSKKS